MNRATADARVSVGDLTSIQRFPVEFMLGEELREACKTPRGVLGDRALALVKDETGRVVSVKRPRRCGWMFDLAATTTPDGVCVTFPDGRAWSAVGRYEQPVFFR